MFRRILVPYDFSEHATQALRLAGELAVAHDGRITVLLVIPPATSLAGISPPSGPVWFPPDDLVAAEQKRLEQQVKRILGRFGVAAACRVAVGDPFQEISSAAERADCVVMGTAGRTGLSHLLIGSIAEKVVRHSPVPVLTTRVARTRGATRLRP
jgi:nucleotide-binding universal stress UspA family protein